MEDIDTHNAPIAEETDDRVRLENEAKTNNHLQTTNGTGGRTDPRHSGGSHIECKAPVGSEQEQDIHSPIRSDPEGDDIVDLISDRHGERINDARAQEAENEIRTDQEHGEPLHGGIIVFDEDGSTETGEKHTEPKASSINRDPHRADGYVEFEPENQFQANDQGLDELGYRNKAFSFSDGRLSFRSSNNGDAEGLPQNGANTAEDDDIGSTHHEKTKKSRKPSKETFINVKSWVAFMSFIATFLATDQMLRYAVLTTLEKRFGFTSVHNGIIVSSYDVGHVVLLVGLSFLGRKIHRPRMCAAGGFLSSVAGILWALPHFLFGSGIPDDAGLVGNLTEITDYGVCLSGTNLTRDTLICEDFTNSTITDGSMSTETVASFVLLLLSQALLGAGFAPFLTVAITYLDDSTDPASSAIGVSIYLSVLAIGPVVGFMFGGFTTSLFVDLTPTELTPDDPEFIGAWWLGSFILAIAIFFVTLPLLAFPRSLKPPDELAEEEMEEPEEEATPAAHTVTAQQKRLRLTRVASVESDSSTGKTRAQRMRPMLQRRVSTLTIASIRDVPRQSKTLGANAVFICVTLCMCCMQYILAGFTPFLPKFIETQFGVDAMLANIITALVTALAAGTGTFVGGYIAAEKELKPLGASKLIIVGYILGIICFVILMFLGCVTPSIAGSVQERALNATTACNVNCTCSNEFVPVCGSDNVNYFSACYAGCSSFHGISDANKGLYGNCSCLSMEDPSGAVAPAAAAAAEAVTGTCGSNCKTLIPYAIITFIGIFCISLGGSPIMSVLIRCVEPEQKSVAMGLNNIATSVLSSIPGPMVYGRMIDSTCQILAPSCDGSGGCLVYNNEYFRYYLHGVTNGFVVLGLLFLLVSYWRLGKRDFAHLEHPPEEQQQQQPPQAKEVEMVPMIDQKV